MHELSIMRALVTRLEDIARTHGATRVVRFTVEIGELANVVPELLEQAFTAFREVLPILRNTTMHIRRIALQVACRTCGTTFHPDGYRFRCYHCGSTDVVTLQGEDLILRDVELEIPEPGDDIWPKSATSTSSNPS